MSDVRSDRFDGVLSPDLSSISISYLVRGPVDADLIDLSDIPIAISNALVAIDIIVAPKIASIIIS